MGGLIVAKTLAAEEFSLGHSRRLLSISCQLLSCLSWRVCSAKSVMEGRCSGPQPLEKTSSAGGNHDYATCTARVLKLTRFHPSRQ